MATRMKKSDVEFHGRSNLPAVNVKVYKSVYAFNDADLAEIAEGDARFNWDWIGDNVPKDDAEWFNIACESGWEMIQSDAKEIFGKHVKVWSEGRSGGWAVVDGLDEVESWDAIMLGKWEKFAKYARAQADDVPYQILSMVYLNVFLTQVEAIDGI